MNLPAPESAQRTRTLIETGLQEAHYLRRTDDRLFALPLSLNAISRLPQNDELSERTDAFATRFGRMLGSRIDRIPRKDSGSGSHGQHSHPWAFIAGKSHRAHANQASRK